jgi:hypothetical protein
MTDLYAFPKPGDPGKSVIVLNVHPSFRLDSPEPTTKEPFAPGALYEVKVDTDGDAVADLAGRPLQAVFLVGEEREACLSGEPANDDRFIGVFAHQLEHTGGYKPEGAMAGARKLLPDILSYDPRGPVSFPHNGRTLTDDVVDVFFSMLTNGKVTGDKVGPHGDLLDEFPYLGPPHD